MDYTKRMSTARWEPQNRPWSSCLSWQQRGNRALTRPPDPMKTSHQADPSVALPDPDTDRAIRAHVIPFVAWLLLMHVPGLPPAWRYALQTVACLAILLTLKPWRRYGPIRVRYLPAAVAVGLFVFVAWVGLETAWFGRLAPAAQKFYLRFGVGLWPFGQIPEPVTAPVYAPAVCGWPLAVVRLLGSALVIAVIEEFFWRGFLYRFLINRSFLKLDLALFRWSAFLIVVALFAVEHQRWLAGLVAGAAYGLLLLRTRDIWAAAAAHVVTNFCLGLYVLGTGAYQFW